MLGSRRNNGTRRNGSNRYYNQYCRQFCNCYLERVAPTVCETYHRWKFYPPGRVWARLLYHMTFVAVVILGKLHKVLCQWTTAESKLTDKNQGLLSSIVGFYYPIVSATKGFSSEIRTTALLQFIELRIRHFRRSESREYEDIGQKSINAKPF